MCRDKAKIIKLEDEKRRSIFRVDVYTAVLAKLQEQSTQTACRWKR